MYVRYSSDIAVNSSSFNNNKAGDDGGVIYADRDCSIFFENNCIFFGNTATEGGVVFLRDSLFTDLDSTCLLYTSPSPRDATLSRMPSSA